MKTALQRFGKFLSAMVMPNIGAFIAWGFITALFIPDGWLPNEQLASIQPYMLSYLLPILIAATGGRMIGKERGMVMGAIAVVGCIAGVGGTDGQPMLMAAMMIGPFAGWIIKKFDQMMEGHMPAGFEMLINNFSIGIFGMIIAIFGYYFIAPFMAALLTVLSGGVELLINKGLLPLSAIFIEPAKVLFLNNAINHGIFTPIGVEQAAQFGKSIMYMLEANPGPGLGVLLAYWFFSNNKITRDSAPGAIIIHFFGGIHEIYFPYVLMNPIVIIAPILGNIFAIAFYTLFNIGLKGPSSPGSIIAFLSMAPKDEILMVVIGILLAAFISFITASFIIKMTNGKSQSLKEAQEKKDRMKAESKGFTADHIQKIIFACDAGMGSSAMGATRFRNRLKGIREDILVEHASVDSIPEDCDIVVVQKAFAKRALLSAKKAQIIEINDFFSDPKLDQLFSLLTEKQDNHHISYLTREAIFLNQKATTKNEAIMMAGQYLFELGYVEESYIQKMLEREELVSTYLANGLAIPHGSVHETTSIKRSGIVLLQFPKGVMYGDEIATLIIGIAALKEDHMNVLTKLADVLDHSEILEKMKTTEDIDWIMEQLS